MKNNILAIILCLGSISLGFVLHHYWTFGANALQSSLASEEFQEKAETMFSSCRLVELNRHGFDAEIYKILLEQKDQKLEKMDERLVEMIVDRYQEIIGLHQRQLIVFNRESDLKETTREYNEQRINEHTEFFRTHKK
tara:strand:- start:2647 stop:3060 length:414 start_codon:yes stop_codon:yes gene_type:complete